MIALRNLLLLLCLVLVCAARPASGAAAITEFAPIENLPLLERERQRPFHTFATEALARISGRATYKEADGRKLSPLQFALSIWSDPESWLEKPLIFINYGPLRAELGFDEKRKQFSFQELAGNPALEALYAEVTRIEKEDGKLNPTQTEVRDVVARISLTRALLDGSAFVFVPRGPGPFDGQGGRWMPPAGAPTVHGAKGEAIASGAQGMLDAYRAGDQTAFTIAANAFSQALGALELNGYEPSSSILRLETFYQKLHPFGWSALLYGLAAVVLGVTSLKGRRGGYKIAWGLILVGFALQIFGFTARILIGGRGPVTNMYESVIWVAFLAIFFAIIMEAIYRSRMVFLAATPLAVILLILADKAPTVLQPSIDPLQSVLRNNFWLSTHVTSITAGYGAFLLALGVAHIVLIKILLRQPVSSALYNYLYRTMQIGVLLLAIGTILGAIWANVSWGRFWDWDPKETWALIALLSYIAILHGRIAGWWKGFGMAIGSILAFLTVVMAWYGVNYVLGEGLHSYASSSGFGAGGVEYVAGYCLLELLFIALTLGVVAKRGGVRAEAPAAVKEP